VIASPEVIAQARAELFSPPAPKAPARLPASIFD